jgi:hypothetical protein
MAAELFALVPANQGNYFARARRSWRVLARMPVNWRFISC